MRRVWVDSSSIASIGYEAATRELEIEFRDSGDVYRYFDVPEEEYAAFLAADSRGTYLNQVFKERNYRNLLVSRGTQVQARFCGLLEGVSEASFQRLPTAELVFVDLHVDALASELYSFDAEAKTLFGCGFAS